MCKMPTARTCGNRDHQKRPQFMRPDTIRTLFLYRSWLPSRVSRVRVPSPAPSTNFSGHLLPRGLLLSKHSARGHDNWTRVPSALRTRSLIVQSIAPAHPLQWHTPSPAPLPSMTWHSRFAGRSSRRTPPPALSTHNACPASNRGLVSTPCERDGAGRRCAHHTRR